MGAYIGSSRGFVFSEVALSVFSLKEKNKLRFDGFESFNPLGVMKTIKAVDREEIDALKYKIRDAKI